MTARPRAIDPACLPAPIRAALAARIHDTALRPAFAKTERSRAGVWTVVLGVTVIWLVAVIGAVDDPRAPWSKALVGALALAIAAVFGIIRNVVAHRRLRTQHRVAPGVYAVGGYLIDTRQRHLYLTPVLGARLTVTPQAPAGAIAGWPGHWFHLQSDAAMQSAFERLEAHHYLARSTSPELQLRVDPAHVAASFAKPPPLMAIGPGLLSLALLAVALGLALATKQVVDPLNREAAWAAIASEHDFNAWEETYDDRERGAPLREVYGFAAAMTARTPSDLGFLRSPRTWLPGAYAEAVRGQMRARYERARQEALQRVGNGPLRAFVNTAFDRVVIDGRWPTMPLTITDVDATLLERFESLPKWRRYGFPAVTAHFRASLSWGFYKQPIRDAVHTLFPSHLFAEAGGVAVSALEVRCQVVFSIDETSPVYYTLDRSKLRFAGVKFLIKLSAGTGADYVELASFATEPAPTFRISTRKDMTPADFIQPVYSKMTETALTNLGAQALAALGHRAATPERPVAPVGPTTKSR